jgi:hypothetical protein
LHSAVYLCIFQKIHPISKLIKEKLNDSSVGFAEITTAVSVENIIAQIKKQSMADNTIVDLKYKN